MAIANITTIIFYTENGKVNNRSVKYLLSCSEQVNGSARTVNGRRDRTIISCVLVLVVLYSYVYKLNSVFLVSYGIIIRDMILILQFFVQDYLKKCIIVRFLLVAILTLL